MEFLKNIPKFGQDQWIMFSICQRKKSTNGAITTTPVRKGLFSDFLNMEIQP
jgi:hypothetical protein